MSRAVYLKTQDFPHQGYSHYDTTIMSIAQLRYEFLTNMYSYKAQFLIPDESEEHLYDWLITNAVDRAVRQLYYATVVGHYKHDVYRLVFDCVQFQYTSFVSRLFKSLQYSLQPGQKLKLMVAGDNIILAKGSIPNVRL